MPRTKKSKKSSKAETQPEITGKEIRVAREELGLTQQQLAGLFGVTLNTLSRWERDIFPPNAPGVIRMALEYLKMRRVPDNSALLRALDQYITNLKAMRERLGQEH